MAVKNTVAITMIDGMEIPANNVIVTSIHFPKPIPQYNEGGEYTGVKRYINYDLFPYKTEADVTREAVTFISGQMTDVPSGWQKEMSDEEYADILADGSLAEVWLKDQLNIWLVGNAATVVDPYVV